MESTVDVASVSRVRGSGWPGGWMVVSPPADGATNMALDEALLLRARRTGETVYRVYGWSAPTVSLGRNQPARGCYDLTVARAHGIEFVRRPTGGRAILHHREITYSVTGADTAFGSLRESYRAVNRLLLEALRALGVDASEAVRSSRSPAPSLAPCFEAPVAGELVANGRKLVGSAQVREGGAFLQHGSILVDDDQHLLNDLLLGPRGSTAPGTLHALTGRAVTISEFATAWAQALAEHHGMAPRHLDLDEPLRSEAQRLACARYADVGWTWRR